MTYGMNCHGHNNRTINNINTRLKQAAVTQSNHRASATNQGTVNNTFNTPAFSNSLPPPLPGNNSGSSSSGQVMTLMSAQARASIVEGYAAEFYSASRIENADFMDGQAAKVWQDFNSVNQNDRDAVTFALIAARFKNAGGNYDNNQLKNLLNKTGNEDLVDRSVGTTDVETMAAVTFALKRNTLELSQIFDADGKQVTSTEQAKPVRY